MTLIDTHAHVHDEAFEGDRAEVLRRAWTANLAAIITVGTDIDESRSAVALAAAEPRIYATVGVHPHDADAMTPATLAELAALARQPKVVAIGEIGLDFYRMLSPKEAQEQALRSQLQLATEVSLPVVIHSRDAHAETYAALAHWVSEQPPSERPRGVMHCFSGDLDLAWRYVELGFLISLAGPVTYPKNVALQQVAAELPLEHLVVETDCPYLSPQSRRGRRNEPANIVETAKRIAELRHCPARTIAAATTRNARRLFQIGPETSASVAVSGRTGRS